MGEERGCKAGRVIFIPHTHGAHLANRAAYMLTHLKTEASSEDTMCHTGGSEQTIAPPNSHQPPKTWERPEQIASQVSGEAFPASTLTLGILASKPRGA